MQTLTLTQLLQGPIVAVIGLGLGILGLISSYVFYRRQERSRDPRWAVSSTTLIEGHGSRLSDLEVLFKGEAVENLSVSRLLFWNNGGVIDHGDIATADSVRVVAIDGTKILDARVLAQNSKTSLFQVSLSADGASAALSFEYLGEGHGAVLQIVHTGIIPREPIVTGAIKGVKTIRRHRGSFLTDIARAMPILPPCVPLSLYWRRRMTWFVLLAMGVSFWLMAGYELLGGWPPGSSAVDSFVTSTDFVTGLFLLSMVLLGLRGQVPRALEAFEYDGVF